MPASARVWVWRLVAASGSLLASIAAIEVGARWIGYDFEQKSRALTEIPIFYRVPDVPTGPFWRRPGPARWQGRVLTPMLVRNGYDPRLFPEEPERVITYDADGFRNPDDLDDWEVAVVGDSFTELGYLPYEELFTTRLGHALGLRVKNLGVSFTGPFTYVHYLETYGAAPGLRDAVLAFFEGNDFDNLVRESIWMEHDGADARDRTGGPGNAPNAPQTSFVRALAAWVFGGPPERATQEARPSRPPLWRFAGADGDVPIEAGRPPPSVAELGRVRRELLDRALGDFARAARALGAKPWLLYLPAKVRVVGDGLRPAQGSEAVERPWRLDELPEVVRRVAERHGIAFIDPIPALRAESAAGRLTYNPVYDSHLNSAGSAVVAEVLARALRP